ncbi:MAG: hypothetical protein HY858_06025 [Candidatus Solibacter usitatus]|nr:hypothetical protein [Candidatus Solibacter usitatus]
MSRPVTRRSFLAAAAAAQGPKRRVFVVPNFHPASCGWLTNFSMERVYCANTYFDHLDRVRDDPEYAFVLSECNNMIAMLGFRPERAAELKRAIGAGRVELVNGFFLESTINLSGGEALVRLGVEGLRWQQEVFGVRPRFAWCIDVCGTHPQMAQITAGLGLEALVYTRGNTTGSALHWFDSPDGTRVPAISPGHYSDARPIFSAKGPLDAKQVEELKREFAVKQKTTPEGAPVLALGGNGDYNLAPLRPDYPRAFAEEWRRHDPQSEVCFTTLSKYFDEVAPGLKAGRWKLPVMRGGTGFFFLSFWIECPRVKTWFRRCERQLLAAESLAAAASLAGRHAYPVEDLHQAWLQMFLNMDRNTLWGAAGGMVFEHGESWDVADRFRSVEAGSGKALEEAGRALAGKGSSAVLFNPLNWRREDPVVLPAASVPAGVACEALGSDRVLCRPALGPVSVTVSPRATQAAPAPQAIALPMRIENRYYTAHVSERTGALLSLCLKPSGKEMLGGAANVLVAERPEKQAADPGDHMLGRAQRIRLGTSSDSAPRISTTRGALATTVVVDGTFFGGGACRRAMRFYHDSPRIDFETTLNDIPDRTVVVAEFPLPGDVAEVRRAVPYGFTHSAWPEPTEEMPGFNKGITPAVGWSHYALHGGGGLAILDRGLSGRELTGRTPVIFLLNATEKYYGYPNSWLSGKGRHVLEYAIVAHEGEWAGARVPHMAAEYNTQPYALSGGGGRTWSFLETSANVLVESMRRDGEFVEVRLVECLGVKGEAEVRMRLPHKDAALTDMVGGNRRALGKGPNYRFAVRPQEIVTLRFQTAGRVAQAKALLDWAPLAPEGKRPALRRYSGEKGHPPRGV